MAFTKENARAMQRKGVETVREEAKYGKRTRRVRKTEERRIAQEAANRAEPHDPEHAAMIDSLTKGGQEK